MLSMVKILNNCLELLPEKRTSPCKCCYLMTNFALFLCVKNEAEWQGVTCSTGRTQVHFPPPPRSSSETLPPSILAVNPQLN